MTINWGEIIIAFFDKLPVGFTIICVAACLSLFISLTFIAIITERNVVLFPPKIGPGPKYAAVENLGKISSNLLSIKNFYEDRIKCLQNSLSETRAKRAETFNTSSTVVYSTSEEKYEQEIQLINSQYIAEINSQLSLINDIIHSLGPR